MYGCTERHITSHTESWRSEKASCSLAVCVPGDVHLPAASSARRCPPPRCAPVACNSTNHSVRCLCCSKPCPPLTVSRVITSGNLIYVGESSQGGIAGGGKAGGTASGSRASRLDCRCVRCCHAPSNLPPPPPPPPPPPALTLPAPQTSSPRPSTRNAPSSRRIAWWDGPWEEAPPSALPHRCSLQEPSW